MKLYWHRWKTRQLGTTFYLMAESWAGDTALHLLGRQYASIRRNYEGRWKYDAGLYDKGCHTWGLTGSPIRSRRLAEEWLDRNRAKVLGSDHPDVDSPFEFVAP